MSRGKIFALVFYAILAVLAITQAGTPFGGWVNWLIIALVAVHALEVLLHFRKCRAAPGSLVGNMLGVFVFGFLHVKDMDAAVARG